MSEIKPVAARITGAKAMSTLSDPIRATLLENFKYYEAMVRNFGEAYHDHAERCRQAIYLLDEMKAAIASRDEPVAAVTGYHGGHCVIEPIDRAQLLPVGMALYSGAQAAVPECVWEQDTDEDSWDTSCGAKWQFIDDGPEENNVHYCHQCGGKVAHKERTE